MLWKYYSCNIIVLLWVYNLTFFTYCHRIMCFFTYLEPLLFGSKEKWMYFFYLFLFLWMYLGPRTYDLWLLFFLQKYCGNLLIIFTLFTNRERIAHWIRWDLDTCPVFVHVSKSERVQCFCALDPSCSLTNRYHMTVLRTSFLWLKRKINVRRS